MDLSYDEMTNAELNIKLKQLENEYESTKANVKKLISKMEKLDNDYIKVQDTLKKRKKSIF